MPFQWKKKTDRVPASPTTIKKAVKKVIENNCPLRDTARKYHLDKMTLFRYVKKYKEKGEETNYEANHNSCQIFTTAEESSLAAYLLIATKMNYGLTPKEARKLAFLFAKANEKKIPQNWNENETASYDWLRGFMSRNQQLSLRSPEPTSLGRGTAFNKHTVEEFYRLLHLVMTRYSFGPESIYNCDETGVQTVHKPGKVISQKGQKQVSKTTSGERGQTVTVCCTINAIGGSIPPFFVFPRVRQQDYMTRGAPPSSEAVTHPSGWMTSDNFELYLIHFIKYTKCSLENKSLLILDNHFSHISPKGLNICKERGVVLLTIPPHTSHKLQPLDVAVYGPFKSYYNQECDNFMVNHAGQTIGLPNIAELVGKAYQRAFTPLNIIRGFSKTGIFPYNPHIFTDVDFLCSSVTDRPEPANNPTLELEEQQPKSFASLNSNDVLLGHTSELKSVELIKKTEFSSSTNELGPGETKRTPEQIRPFPKAPSRKKISGRRPAKTRILTDTPTKQEIEAEHANRLEKKLLQVQKKISFKSENRKTKKEPVKKLKRRSITYEEITSDDNVSISSCTSSSNNDTLKNEIEDESANGISKYDYVIVRFNTKKTTRHYVGQIIDIPNRTIDQFYVNFMRQKKPGNRFVFPNVPDEGYADTSSVKKLPYPKLSGGTARMDRMLTFSINLNKYENIC